MQSDHVGEYLSSFDRARDACELHGTSQTTRNQSIHCIRAQWAGWSNIDHDRGGGACLSHAGLGIACQVVLAWVARACRSCLECRLHTPTGHMHGFGLRLYRAWPGSLLDLVLVFFKTKLRRSFSIIVMVSTTDISYLKNLLCEIWIFNFKITCRQCKKREKKKSKIKRYGQLGI